MRPLYIFLIVLVPVVIATIVIGSIILSNSSKSKSSSSVPEITKSDMEQALVGGFKLDTINDSEHSKLSLVDEIYIINMEKHPDRMDNMANQIEPINALFDIPTFRFNAYAELANGALGCFKSHVGVLLYNFSRNKNILILEDDFVFQKNGEELKSNMTEVQKEFGNRWDTVVFGQYVHKWQHIANMDPMRILHSTTTSGYLVNKDYVQVLYEKWSSHLMKLWNKTTMLTHEENLDQIQIEFQKEDLWIGFGESIGHQKVDISTISNSMADNRWTCTPDRKEFNGVNILDDKVFEQKKVCVCLIATGKYKKFLAPIMNDCYTRFIRNHKLSFLLFTDEQQASHSAEGVPIHCVVQEKKGFPGDTLYRYHYFLSQQDHLKTFDYAFYMDVDYGIYQRVTESDMLHDMVATSHIYNVERDHSENHVGTPEINADSAAFIKPSETMDHYFAGGFLGGKIDRFLHLCSTVKSAIDRDDENGIMAIWHDESHINRYFLDNPPSKVLNQSFIYPEFAINDENNDIGILLRKHNIPPIMVPLDKNHDEIRS